MTYTIEERPEYGKYVTAKLPRVTPIYRWFSYPHSFSRELVHELLDFFGARPGEWVLDPYVGAGTTLLACREKSIQAFGIDELPLSVFVSNAKSQSYDVQELKSCIDSFFMVETTSDPFGTIPVVDVAFTPYVRGKINSIYTWTSQLSLSTRNFFILALLSILENISQTAKSGGWLRIIENQVDQDQVEVIYKAKVKQMIEELELSNLPNNCGESWYAIQGDARTIDTYEHPVKYVITSPPYLNRHDYTRVFALEMALHFVKTNADLIAIRSQALRSHVEARPLENLMVSGYSQPQSLTSIINKIKEISSKSDRRRVPKMIEGYFEDMYSCLKALYSGLEDNGKVAFVLGNVRFSGVSIPVDEIVAEIGEQAGFQMNKIIIARYRGNSAQQMKEFGREPSRESIIIWQKTR